MAVLERIDHPHDLKKLKPAELYTLAQEIRQAIIDTINHNGGHLASSLGAVELTIVLHRTFDSPKDKIVWDVGHQAYAHKLLTGRREEFGTIRKYGGLSGFTCREESEHDPFGAGHASTSISAALGIAKARDIRQEDFHVVAVIGDGAIGGGMAFEALNNAAQLKSRLIVVLNDNGMSISPTVGALARILNRVRFNRRYGEAKEKGKHILKYLPLGQHLANFGRSIKRQVKRLIIPGNFWEELGFAYMGPFDGHNIEQLEEALKQAKDYRRRPVLVHVVTTKGKGYSPAECDATSFHGLSPKSGITMEVPSYSDIFSRTVLRLMQEDRRIVVITAAMADGNCLVPVQKCFPDRVFDVGICEEHAVTFAAGLASQGTIPIVAIYSTFLQRAFDQIIHDVCLQRLPVVFAIDRAGIVGEDGKTHQGIFDLSYLSLIPHLTVASPKDENELQHLIYTAVNSGGPMAIRYPRGSGIGVRLDEDLRNIPLGRSELLREGADIAILAVGSTVYPSLEAANALEAEGIAPTVLNARFVKPLDRELILEVARRVRRIITVEENVKLGGFGSQVGLLLSEAGLSQVQLRCISLPDQFVEHGESGLLRKIYGLDKDGILAQARELLTSLILSREGGYE